MKRILFLSDPEAVHDRFKILARIVEDSPVFSFILNQVLHYDNPNLQQRLMGQDFRNPVGLSAGFDKDADFYKVLEPIGFGFTQIGSVTDQPYKGNPGKRVIRLPEAKSLLINYGLKNIGADLIIERVQSTQKPDIPISISIAKTNSPKAASREEAVKDYCSCIQKFIEADIGDIFTLNISCPNTYGGEPFTNPEDLRTLLNALSNLNLIKPMLIKMPLNLPWQEFRELLDVAAEFGFVKGVVIANLQKNRKSVTLKDEIDSKQKGSLSGLPTKELSNKLISLTYRDY